MKSTRNFASRWGFILASVGSAVGMANVWGFPNKLGSNGGGAFLLIYLMFVVIFSYVGLPAEFAMGRRAATGTLGAYENAWATRGKTAGKVVGLLAWLPLAGSLCIALGYAVIVTYILKALVDSLVGTLMSEDAGAWFGAFSSTPYGVIPYHVIVVVGTLLTLYLGARSIEKTNKIMMPLFFIIFLILAVRVAMLPDVSEGYRFMFTPRWEALKDPMIWIWAMGQAFFSLSVAGNGSVIYGSYLSKKENVISSARNVAVFDTIAALLAAFVIIPATAVGSAELEKGGPGLMFIYLVRVLNNMAGGRIVGMIFFICVLFAALSSILNLYEAPIAYMQERFGLKRLPAVLVIGLIGTAVSVLIQPWTSQWMDVVSIYICPAGALLAAIMFFWVLKKQTALDAVNEGAEKSVGKWFYPMGKYVFCLCALVALVAGALLGGIG